MNFLEQLASEWYEFQGYFVIRNRFVGLRPKGGWDCELDVVAYCPVRKHLLHIECSNDANSWAVREKRFKVKFDAGRLHIPKMFNGMKLPKRLEQIALLQKAGKVRQSLAGGKVLVASKFLDEIIHFIQSFPSDSKHTIPEKFHTLRTIQFVHLCTNGTLYL